MKTKTLSSKWLAALCAVLVLLVLVFAFTLKTDAAELAGKDFPADVLYEMTGNVTPNGPVTFEFEIYIPDAYKTASRAGSIISNYDNGVYKDSWAFEIRSGHVFLFGDNGALYYETGYNITQHMGTDANPQYVKLAVTADTATGLFTIYVNGVSRATYTYANAANDLFNTTKTLVIGGDRRNANNTSHFLGNIKSIAMYKGIRDYKSATYFDTSDANMLFGYDMTKAYDGFLKDLSKNNNNANNTKWKPTEGTSFVNTTTNQPTVSKAYTEAPYTYEAVVYTPLGTSRGGPIIANYPNANGDSFMFEVKNNGKPALYIWDNGAWRINYEFNYDTRRNAFVHIAITHETVYNSATGVNDTKFTCYVNGNEYVETYTVANYVFKMDMASFAKTRNYTIGYCGRNGLYQLGYIKNITLRNRALTAAEVMESYRNGTNPASDEVIAYYDLTSVKDGLIADKSGNGYHANYPEWKPTEGKTFSEGEDPLYMTKDLEEIPFSYEAVVYAPVGVSRPGPIISNYPNTNGDSIMFDIKDGGKPGIYIYDDGEARINHGFNYDIRGNGFVHVAITHENNDSNSVFKCYVNGELVDTLTLDYVFSFNINTINQTGPMTLGHCGRVSLYYKGNIKNAAMHNKVLTADEIKASYKNGVNANKNSLIAYYDLTGANATSESVSDASGNGYDFKPMFYTKDFETEDYDYAFAVIGDTQFLVHYDTINGTNYTESIYKYIKNNIESKKIKQVIGLGDIIDNNKWPDGTSSKAAEWAYAKNLIVSYLGNNNIPYSLIAGNHDFMRPYDTGFQASFGNETSLTKNITGYYVDGDVYNYYMNFDVEGTPYMILALEYGANDDILAWANNVIAQNRHRRVIITTHGYMNRDGTTLDGSEFAAPKPNGTTDANYLKYNNGDEMWDEMVKLHPNVAMVLSGHIDPHNIVWREDNGNFGNSVQQFLIDPQAMDKAYAYKTGMVAMFYFRNGGKDVSVEYVSTYRTENNTSGEEILFNPRNQFDFTIKEAPKQADKGEINVWLMAGQSNAAGYANGLSQAQSLDPRYTNGFNNVLYYGYSEKWQSSFTPVKAGFGNTSNASGAELGIAEILGNTGEMNAIIKYAQGATALYPVTTGDAAVNYGTWTSPSYITKYSTPTDGNKTGDLYISFINTVRSAIAELKRMGYTPVIRGMWWMQGEEETYNGGAGSYKEMLDLLAKDVRSDLTVPNLPFIIGKVYTPSTSYADLATVQAQQAAFAAADAYADIVDPTAYASFGQQDNWHFDAATQGYLGRSFVEKACAINGDIIVRASSGDVTFTGGGIFPKTSTETITVGISPVSDTMQITSVTKKVGASSKAVTLTEGKYAFALSGQNVTFDVALNFDKVDTDYGTVPPSFADGSASPIVLFDGNKSFLGAYTEFGAAVNAAVGFGADGDYIILLQNNAQQSTGGFVSSFGGTITVDLGGYTITKSHTNKYLIDAFYNDSSEDLSPTITFKNGYLVSESDFSFFCVNYGVSLKNDKTISFVFDNVSFKSNRGSNTIMETWDDGGSLDFKVTTNMVLNNCIFDYTGTAANEVMFDMTNGSSASVFNAVINGGKIVSDRTVGLADIATMDALDSVKFGKSENGYTVCELPSDIEISTQSFTSTNGKALSFSDGVASNGKLAYTLGEDVKTSYGTIPFRYTNANSYPFVVFKNGSFVGAYAAWGLDNNPSALSWSKTAGSVILMRRDYTNPAGTQYNNLSQTINLTVDLGGFTFDSSRRAMFFAQKKTTNDTTVKVINGNVLLGSHGLIALDTWNPATVDPAWGTYTGGNGFNITYEGVNISLVSGATTANLLCYDAFTNNNVSEFLNATFKNCTLDIRNGGSAITLFDMSNALAKITAIIDGGRIITAGQTVALANTEGANAESSVSFAKTSGAYTELVVPSGSAAGIGAVNGGSLIFVKKSDDGTNTTYALAPKAVESISFTPSSSITLDSNLILNIYIPENAYLTGFTLDGKTYAIGDLTATDGKYLVATELDAKTAGRELTLVASFNVSGEELSATYTFSTLKYAKKLLANENATATTKTLVCNMLAYVKSAYAYFAETDTEKATAAEVANAIDAIIGNGYTTFEKVEGATTNMTVGEGVTFILDSTPRIRFYFAEGTDLTNYAFKIDGVAQKFTATSETIGKTNFVCADISLFAYKMIGTIEVFEDGASQGTFHINAYHDFALTQSNDALVEVVERFYEYCKSAKAYRDEVIAGQ